MLRWLSILITIISFELIVFLVSSTLEWIGMEKFRWIDWGNVWWVQVFANILALVVSGIVLLVLGIWFWW